MYSPLIKKLIMEIIQEVLYERKNDAVKQIVTASGGKLEKQKYNRVRSTGSGMSEEDFIDLIISTFDPIPDEEGKKVRIIPPVKGKTPSDYESSLYSSYAFTPTPKDEKTPSEEVTLILSDPKRKQSNRERQEHSIISIINSTPGLKNIVAANNVTIKNVKEAKKSTAKGPGYRQQPYADIDLYVEGKDKPVKISAKGLSAPSLGGAGLTGVVALGDKDLLDFVRKFYNKVLELAKQKDTGDKYIQIPENYVVKLFTGNELMGGPIDYYYKGSLDVVSSIDDNNNIKLDGSLLPVSEYIGENKFYFRITRRRTGGGITDKVRPGINIPVIYVDDYGKANSRLLVSDSIPASATEVQL